MVPNAGWSKRHGEMIRIDDERRAVVFVVNSFLLKIYREEK